MFLEKKLNVLEFSSKSSLLLLGGSLVLGCKKLGAVVALQLSLLHSSLLRNVFGS